MSKLNDLLEKRNALLKTVKAFNNINSVAQFKDFGFSLTAHRINTELQASANSFSLGEEYRPLFREMYKTIMDETVSVLAKDLAETEELIATLEKLISYKDGE